MPRATTSRPKQIKSRPVMSHVRDKRGRLDVLVMRLAERVVERQSNPIIKGVFKEFAPDLTHLAAQYLGPRNPRAKRVRKLIVRLGEQGAFRQLESVL